MRKKLLTGIVILVGLIALPGCVAESACDVVTTPDQRSVNLIFSFGNI